MIYEALNVALLRRIPPGVRRVLDLGCGTGAFGERLRAERPDCTVLGVTFSDAEASDAAQRLDAVLVRDLDAFDVAEVLRQPGFAGGVDCVVCSHVLEHLLRPEELLRALTTCLTRPPETASLVVALPNVMFWKQRANFLRGRFRYTDGGIMDRTHRTFYDWETARALLTRSGFRIESAEADGACPLPVIRPLLGGTLAAKVDRTVLRHFPNAFGFQFIFVARPAAGAGVAGGVKAGDL